jgi:hypothetical protein
VPRKSAAALSVVVPVNVAARLHPPRSLTKAEQEVFIELASHATHLKPADVPLLASLAQAILLSRRLAHDPTKVAEWEKAVRAQAMLSTKLRMTPQSRTDSRGAGRHQQEAPGADPW